VRDCQYYQNKKERWEKISVETNVKTTGEIKVLSGVAAGGNDLVHCNVDALNSAAVVTYIFLCLILPEVNCSMNLVDDFVGDSITYSLYFHFNIVLCRRTGQDETPGKRPFSSIIDNTASFCPLSISFLPSLPFMFMQLPLSRAVSSLLVRLNTTNTNRSN
jgi:hypothetical protein